MAALDNTFGIEIECYLPEGGTQAEAAAAITSRLGDLGCCIAETYNHMTRDYWKIVTDGSLGDYQRGIEVVSPVLTGEAGVAAMRRVMDALDDYGCTVTRSCGLHVHVGVSRVASTTFFKNLLKLYAFFEPVIDSFMPPSRRASANMYCRSVTHLALSSIDGADDITGLIRLMTGRRGTVQARYHKLNIDAYRRHGTVEFRQHSGTLDGRKAQQWLMLCLRMVEAAKSQAPILTGTTSTSQLNGARPGSKAYLVGQMLLRPEGVTREEAMAATGWPSISLPQQAGLCGLQFTTQRIGRTVRYFARAAEASAPATATLSGLMTTLGCTAGERDYFAHRTANLSPQLQWAA